MLDSLVKYLEVNLELIKLDTKETAVRIIAKMMKAIVMMILGAFTLLFISLAFAYYLDTILGSAFYGFFVVGLFYLLLFVLFWLFRKKISAKIRESIDEEIPIKLEFENDK
jgi:uncharacterized BrkB/YihY/UPF0761 family membrane protein